MDATAKLSTKGQITIPRDVRAALGLHDGDQVLFRVVDGRAVMARTPDLLELEGAVTVPPDVRELGWGEIRDRAHAAQATRHR